MAMIISEGLFPFDIHLGKKINLSGDPFLLTIPPQIIVSNMASLEGKTIWGSLFGEHIDILTFRHDTANGRHSISFHSGLSMYISGSHHEGHKPVIGEGFLQGTDIVSWQPVLLPLRRDGGYDTLWVRDNPAGTTSKGGVARIGTELFGSHRGTPPDILESDLTLDIINLPGDADDLRELDWVSIGYGLMCRQAIARFDIKAMLNTQCLPLAEVR